MIDLGRRPGDGVVSLQRGGDAGPSCINVSEWIPAGDEDLGTKPKRWLIEPDTRVRWLMKDATFNEPIGEPRYRKGDDWAELVASRIASAMGLPAAQAELAVSHKHGETVHGIVCRSVLRPDEHLVLGNVLLAERGLVIARRERGSYTMEAIRRTLSRIEPPTGVEGGMSAWEAFVGYLVLDALIGNTDRHEENWGTIEVNHSRRLAPTFDHASSLGFLLSDTERRERLASKDGNRTPEGFADRAKTPFDGKPHPIDVVADAAREPDGRNAARYWIDRLRRLDDLAEPIRAVPEHRMPAPAKQFAERVIRRNWARLSVLSPLHQA